jgi:hypothetical protein
MFASMTLDAEYLNIQWIIRRMMSLKVLDTSAPLAFSDFFDPFANSFSASMRQNPVSFVAMFPTRMIWSFRHGMGPHALTGAIHHLSRPMLASRELLITGKTYCSKHLRLFPHLDLFRAFSGARVCSVSDVGVWALKQFAAPCAAQFPRTAILN